MSSQYKALIDMGNLPAMHHFEHDCLNRSSVYCKSSIRQSGPLQPWLPYFLWKMDLGMRDTSASAICTLSTLQLHPVIRQSQQMTLSFVTWAAQDATPWRPCSGLSAVHLLRLQDLLSRPLYSYYQL